ncbi:MAG: hypothetical protein M1826_002973 [Phylliscum demangeonii]|nr:MAG: hypothetical protein M1826_002973 [Phylliscum demangeonii]
MDPPLRMRSKTDPRMATVEDNELSVEKGIAQDLHSQADPTDMMVMKLPEMTAVGGKSTLFQLQSLIPDGGITVVIVPLVALRQDLARQCQERQIPFTDWGTLLGGIEDMPLLAPLVLVGAEQALQARFLQVASTLQHQERLARIVLDEAHLALTAASYRPLLPALGELRRLPVPFICLSATLPPIKMPAPMEIRASADQPNLRYEMRKIPDARGWVEQVVAVIQRTLNGQVSNGPYPVAGIICERVADELQAAPYHAQLNHHSRARALAWWSVPTESRRLLVGTSALGAGIDYPAVSVVFHVEAPFGAMDYAQATGGAGRNGQAALCRMFCNGLGMHEPGPMSTAHLDRLLGRKSSFAGLEAANTVLVAFDMLKRLEARPST